MSEQNLGDVEGGNGNRAESQGQNKHRPERHEQNYPEEDAATG